MDILGLILIAFLLLFSCSYLLYKLKLELCLSNRINALENFNNRNEINQEDTQEDIQEDR